MARAESLIAGLEGMPAMEGVAEQLQTILNRQLLIEDHKRKGLKPRHDFKHMILEGPPGTGKSTLMGTVGEVLSLIGATKSAEVVEIKPTDIGGKYVGDAEEAINAKLAETKGGVLVVDEAHQFANNDYTKNALRALVATLADPTRSEVIVIAGYSKDIHEALSSIDPGLESRFKYRMAFDRYDADQLFEAAEWQMKDASVRNKDKKAERAMEQAMDVIDSYPDHASGRDVDYMLSYALNSVADRWNKNHSVPNDVIAAEDWKYAIAQYEKRRVPV